MTSGGREALKWLSLVLMTGDHVNKVLLHGSQPWLTDLARVVFPIFALVLAYNLVRVESIRPALVRLAIAAAIVQPFHALVFDTWWPVNVLATFALALAMMRLWVADRRILALGLLVLSPAADYGVAGVGFTFAAWLWFKGERWAALPAALALLGLCLYNGNAWALVALPLVWAVMDIEIDIPRWRWLFLGYYVGHLVVLAVVAGLRTGHGLAIPG